MESSEVTNTYYIRSRGKVLGPFSVERLKTLQARGQFTRVHEVSTDGKGWQPASKIDGVFETTLIRSSQAPISKGDDANLKAVTTSGPTTILAPPVPGSPNWYYHLAGQQHGPLPLGDMQSLVRSGQLKATDLVWSDSLSDWVPLGDVNELASAQQAPNGSSGGISAPGAHQMFCFSCGLTISNRAEICPQCGVRQRSISRNDRRNRTTAALLAFFLGGIGAHHFYLGQPAIGIVYLLFFWTLIPGFIAFIEFITYVCMSDESFNEKYNRG